LLGTTFVLFASAPVLAKSVSDTAFDVACSMPQLTDHRPTSGQDEVPPDASVMLAFTGDGCQNQVQVTISNDEHIDFDEEIRINSDGVVLVLDDLALQAEQTYTVLALAIGYTEESADSFTFTTGSEGAVAVFDSPAISIYMLTAELTEGDAAIFEAEFHVSATATPSGITLVEVVDSRSVETLLASAFVPGTGELELAARWGTDFDDESICLQARQIDAWGQAGDWGEPDCLTPEIKEGGVDWTDATSGCAGCTARPTGTWGWVLLLPGLALVRRRAG
jgi:hypothetical protein